MHLLIADRLVCPRCGPPFALILLADRVVERRVLAGSLGCPNCRDRFPVVDGFADVRAPPRTPLRVPTGQVGARPVETPQDREESAADAETAPTPAPAPAPPAPAPAPARARTRAPAPASAAVPDTPADTPADTARDAEPDAEPNPEQTLRLAAFLGVTEGPAQVALVGPVAAHAAGLAGRVAELEVAAVSASLLGAPEQPGVSRMVAAPGLPFQDGALRGVVLSGEACDRLLEEAARTLAPGARMVLLGAPEDARDRVEAAGLRVLLAQGGAPDGGVVEGGVVDGGVPEGGVVIADRTGPRVPSSGTRLPVI